MFEGVLDKEFIWNLNNCECECNQSCEAGECLDYENCKCRKRLVDELAEECTENVEEVSLAEISSTAWKCLHMFLHNLCCLSRNNLYNQHRNWYLFCLLQIHELY